jgi:hypothetical protein
MLVAPICLLLLTAEPPAESDEADPDKAQTTIEPEKPAAKTEPADVRADDFFSFSDFVDTRVTFAFSNINVFAGPGERLYPSSGYRIGIDPNFNLFLENVNTRFSGYETLSQLVLYKKIDGFWANWETEAALAARLSANVDTGEVRFFDAGTYLRIIKKLGAGPEADVGSIDLTAWPVSSDRFRLGYTFLISWGGTTIFPGKLVSRISEGAVPGFRLRWRSEKGKDYAFIGFKSALIQSVEANQRAGEQVPQYGFLGGLGFTVADHVILETNGGYFQKGTQETLGLEGRQIHAFGVSGRVTFFEGAPPPSSSDYKLYRNDPTAPDDYLLYKPYKPGTGYSVGLEGNFLGQNLADPDNFGSEKLVTAYAAGLVGLAKIDELNLRLDAFIQSADFILFDVPGFVPFRATFETATTKPEFFFSGTVEYYLRDLEMKPSLAVGVKVPATYLGAIPPEQGNIVGGARPGDVRVQVIADNRTRIILPPETDSTPVIGALFKLPTYLSKSTSISAEVRLELNDNQPRIAQDNELGQVTYFFDDPLRLSVAAVFQSRW